MAFGVLVAFCFHYAMSSIFEKGYPWSTFLFIPNDRFNDFNNMYKIVSGWSPYHSDYWFQSVYFPFANVFFGLFSFISKIKLALTVFFGIFLLAYGFITIGLAKVWGKEFILPAVVLGFINYPILFALDRANVEIYLFLFLLGFLYFHYVNRKPLVAIVFLAMATSMKLYPGIFILLYLREKQFREIAVFLGICMILTIGSLALFEGGIVNNIVWMLDSLKAFSQTYIGPQLIQHSISLWSVVLLAVGGIRLILGFREDPFAVFPGLEWAYLAFVLIVFIWSAWLIVRQRGEVFDSVSILFLAMMLFPTVSYDYKLLYALIPMAMSLFYSRRRTEIALWGLILLPKAYWPMISDITISVAINIFCLAVLYIRSIRRLMSHTR